jgi:hypothetical protein
MTKPEGPNKSQTEKIAKLLSGFGNEINVITKQMESDHLVQPAIAALEAASNQFVINLKLSIHPSAALPPPNGSPAGASK